jgi:hypothetical protein
VLALAAGLAEGLSAIHAAGVIHRDLKPSNVLLAPDGPRIIDFGISSAAEATSLTGTGHMVGSPGFMSPEQAEGLAVGPASDIFSLAGVLIYAARGDGPFGTGDTAALLYRVVHGTPNLDQVPDGLRPLIMRSLSRDATRRPTATEFLTELSAAYPTAANLIDWLPPQVLGLTGQRAASAETSVHQPAPAGAFGPAITADAAGVAGVRADPDPAEPLTIRVPPVGAPLQTPMDTDTDEPLTIRVPPVGAPLQTPMDTDTDEPLTIRVPPIGAPTQTSVPGGVLGYPGARQYQAPQGYSAGQGYPDDRGGLVAPRRPGTDEWYRSPSRPGRGRKRPRWLLPAVGAVVLVVLVVVGALVVALGGRSHQSPVRPGSASPTSSTASASPTSSQSSSPRPDGTPTVGNLQLAQFQAGDCLTGANMDLNTNAPWPKTTLAVPCSQSHTAQVFYANSSFWPKNGAYPGNSTISKEANAECDTAFASYVGIAYSKSKYTWTNIVPDSSTWPNGDRALHCVAYDATTKQPAGAPMTGSIEGTRR